MSLEQQLKEIGLEEKEAKVYLSALELGPSNIQDMTLKSGLKRSTVYEILKSLAEKGLVSETKKGKKRIFLASDPGSLKKSIAYKEKLLNEILPELNALNNIGFIKPKISFYEGREGIRQIYRDTLETKEKMTYWFSPIQSMIETIGEDFLNKYVEERTKKGIWVKSVYITSQKVLDYKYLDPITFEKTLRKIKFTPPEIDIANTMAIYGNKVAIMSSKKEGFGFVIESVDYQVMMKTFHDMLWSISKPYGEMNFNRQKEAAEKEIKNDY